MVPSPLISSAAGFEDVLQRDVRDSSSTARCATSESALPVLKFATESLKIV